MNYINVSCWNCNKITRKIIRTAEQVIYCNKCSEVVLIVDETLLKEHYNKSL